MVKKHFHFSAIALELILTLFVLATMSVANAQTREYSFDHQWAQIFINQDGTIDLTYNVTLTLDSGDDINYVWLGQPNGDFEAGQAFDQFGHQLQAAPDNSGNDYRVKVALAQPLTAGSTVWFTVSTNVGHMIFNDTQNQGNLGMQFAPEWQQIPISDVRIQIILPPGVSASEIATPPNYDWNSTAEIDGRLAVYWQTPVLQPNQRYLVGVSFPAKYLPSYNPEQQSGNGDFLANYGVLLVLSAFAIIIIVAVVVATRKQSYLTPKVSIETLGVKRGLTAVEASYLLNLKPTQVVTEILYSLLQKRAAWVESTNPALKLRIMPPFHNKTGSEENPLRYYEIDFLNAVKNDGALDEEKLAHTVMYLRDTLEQKLRGHNRRDTQDYYRKIVAKAWSQVEQAGTVDLASKAYDEQLLWLLLDPNYRGRTETTFNNRAFEPSPFWFWYWYGYRHYNPHPAYSPNVDAPNQASKPPTIPGTEFANNIATAVEKTSSNIVVNIEKFANAIIPIQTQKASHAPAPRGGGCVCACAACACACACVSCACACAGGGAG
jgi:hypothetical protein